MLPASEFVRRALARRTDSKVLPRVHSGVINFEARQPVQQPPHRVVRFMDFRWSGWIIEFEQRFTLVVDSKPGGFGFGQHPSERDGCRQSFLVTSADIGVTAAKPDFINTLGFVL